MRLRKVTTDRATCDQPNLEDGIFHDFRGIAMASRLPNSNDSQGDQLAPNIFVGREQEMGELRLGLEEAI